MNEEARPSGDRSRHRAPRRRSRWARRTPYGIRRDGGFRDESRAPLDPHDDATYAALDLGTNNCRLLIARPTANGFRVVDAFSRIIRLGEGVAASRRISEAAIARAVEALLVCRDKMRARGVVRARLIATAACRAAENAKAFRARVADEAGVELEIVDFGDGGETGGGRLHGTVGPGRWRRHPVRYRRRLFRAGAARPAERRWPRTA